jgi:activating signal cointegrator complex subunit 3
LNADLSNDVPLKVNSYALDSPHTKVNLLLQAHFSRVSLPTSDYLTVSNYLNKNNL